MAECSCLRRCSFNLLAMQLHTEQFNDHLLIISTEPHQEFKKGDKHYWSGNKDGYKYVDSSKLEVINKSKQKFLVAGVIYCQA